MRTFVLTSDNYSHSVLPFAYLFNKYYTPEQEVIVAGFDKFPDGLPPNFKTHSIGKQSDYPLRKWSDGLIKLLHDFTDEVFLLFLEDYFIVQPVYQQEVRMLYDYMNQFKYVLKMDTNTDRRFAGGVQPYGMCGHIPLVKSDPNSQYHCSLMNGLWNRELFLRILIPNEDPWQVELEGTSRLAKYGDSMIVLGTETWDDNLRTCPIKHTLAYRGGDSSKMLIDEIKPEDVEALKKLGYI